jgi:HEAT repeat protein
MQSNLRHARTGAKGLCTHHTIALGNLKDVESIPVLLQTVQDAKMPLELRLPAANAISMMGGEAGGRIAEKLGLLLIDEGTPKDLKIAVSIALDSQESFAYPAWKPMVTALKDRDAAVRSIILHCLGNIGAKLQKDFKVVQAAVLGCVNDSALEVRLAAVETLGRWGPELSDDEVLNAHLEDTFDGMDEVENAHVEQTFEGMDEAEVDDAIEKVLLSGGDVEFVENDVLKNYHRIALVLNY